MIYNPPFFSNFYYKRAVNSNQYANKYSNTNFNNYTKAYPNSYLNNYSNSFSNNYYKKQNLSSLNNKFESKDEKKVQSKERNKEPELFEIFGIKLHFDDILLICLIFFLYNEGVKDQYLFISLILLLLT